MAVALSSLLTGFVAPAVMAQEAATAGTAPAGTAQGIGGGTSVSPPALGSGDDVGLSASTEPAAPTTVAAPTVPAAPAVPAPAPAGTGGAATPTLTDQAGGDAASTELDAPTTPFTPAAVTDQYKFLVSLAAAAPKTYEGSRANTHPAGGGHYNGGPSDPSSGAVQELLARFYSCGDVVSYFLTVGVDGPEPVGQQSTIEADLKFAAGSDVDPGAALSQVLGVSVLNDDAGTQGNRNSVAVLKGQTLSGELYTKNAQLLTTIIVNNVERGDFVIVRVDVRLSCRYGAVRDGYLIAGVDAAREVSPNQQNVVPSPLQVQMVHLADLNTPFSFAVSANPTKVIANRDVVTYTLRFASTQTDAAVTVREITDSVLGDVTNPANPKLLSTSCSTPILVPPLGSAEKTCTYTAKSNGAPRSVEVHNLLASDGIGGFAADSVSIRIADPRIAISKAFDEITNDADRSGTVTPGDTISFLITVTNIGDIGLSGVVVTDLLAGTTAPECSGLTNGVLAEGADATCTVRYTVTAADARAGSVENTASVRSNEASAANGSVSVGVLPTPTTVPTTATTQQPATSAPSTTEPPPSPTRPPTVLTGNLPFTGADTVRTIAFAVAALAAGAALLVVATSSRRPVRPLGY